MALEHPAMFSLFALGSNGSGQLGVGDNDDRDSVTKVVGFPDKVIKKIAGGGNHTLVLCTDGTVYQSGSSSRSSSSSNHCTFTSVPGRWHDVACGWEYSVLCTETSVYSMGKAPQGGLGLGPMVKETAELRLVAEFESQGDRVDYVQSSVDHVVVRLVSGDFYGWGRNKHAQLAETKENFLWTPQKIASRADSSRTALGREFTVWLSAAGEIVVKGKLTNLHKDPDFEPFVSQRQPNVADIDTMWSSVHVRLSNGQVLSFGNNSHGQKLNRSQSEKLVAQQFVAGSEHGVVLNVNDGTVYSWGWGEHGNCGAKSDSVVYNLNRIFAPRAGERVYLVAAGCATTFVATVRTQPKVPAD